MITSSRCPTTSRPASSSSGTASGRPRAVFDLPRLTKRREELEARMADSAFWSNSGKAKETVEELKRLKATI
ncbi:MAG: hypothetical protein L6Q95_05995, partial [Planctomycetes bacterium]|nr:hypothetical protein [Planctomycetota bacterium]